MARGVDGETFRQVRMLFEAGTLGGLTDGQLLERFRAREGASAEPAFAALVERHGTMVLRVCRRTLRDEHDAQDAFQATFLVLVRKAGSLSLRAGAGGGDSLGPWLHAVACRVAACARSAAARRRSHERRAAEAAGLTRATAAGDWDDLGQVLHEEINRLPSTYRAAVVLCDLEGLTQEQAAQRLGWPSGTVRSRLARGRGRLQARLTRRGLAPSTGALAAILTAEAASAGVPTSLLESTLRAAMGPIAARTIPAAMLTEGVLKAMFLTKLKWITASVFILGAGAVGPAVLALQPRSAGKPSGAPVIAKAGSEPGGPEVALAEGPAEPSGQDPPEVADSQITLAEVDLKRAEERLAWSNRMLEKGYVSIAQNLADRQAVEQARLALERAQKERKPPLPEPPPRDTKPGKTNRDEAAHLATLIDSAQTELKTALLRYQRVKLTNESKASLRDKDSGPLSEAERNLADAEMVFALAEIKLKDAELKLLTLRWEQAKRGIETESR